MTGIKLKNSAFLLLSAIFIILFSYTVIAPCCLNQFKTDLFCADLNQIMSSTGVAESDLELDCCDNNVIDCDFWTSADCDYTSRGECNQGCCIIDGACDDYYKVECDEDVYDEYGTDDSYPDYWNPDVACNSIAECGDVCCCGYDEGAQDILVPFGECDGEPNFGPTNDEECAAACSEGEGSICGPSAQTCTNAVTNINPCFCGTTFMGSSSELEGYCCKGTPYLFDDYATASETQDACFLDSECTVPAYTISGVVVNIYDVPVIGATVSASGITTTTDQNGLFTLEEVIGGPISVDVIKTNFNPKSESVYLISNVEDLKIVIDSSIPYCALGEEISSQCICGDASQSTGWCCIDGTHQAEESFCPESYPSCIENEYVSNNIEPCRCGFDIFETPDTEATAFCCADGTVTGSISECPTVTPFCKINEPLDANDDDCRCRSPSGDYVTYGVSDFPGYFCCEEGLHEGQCPTILGPTCAQQGGTWCDITEICAVDSLEVTNPTDIEEHPNKRCCDVPRQGTPFYNQLVAEHGQFSMDLLEIYACETPTAFCSPSDCSNPIAQNCQCGYGLAIAYDSTNPTYCCAADSAEFGSDRTCYFDSTSCRPKCEDLGLGDITQSEYNSCYCEGALRDTGWCCEDDTWFDKTDDSSCVVHEDTINLRGIVTDCDTGAPLNNVTVNIRRSEPFWGNSYITGSDPAVSDGSYAINNVPINHLDDNNNLITSDYDIFGVRMLDYYTKELPTTTFPTDNPKVVTVNFCLQHLPYWNISGYVYDALNGTPINDVTVRLLTKTVPKIGEDIIVDTNLTTEFLILDPEGDYRRNGTFTLANIIEGQHTLEFSKFPPYAPKRVRINLIQDEFINTSMFLYNCFTNKELGLMMDLLNGTPNKQQVEVHWHTPCQATGFNLYRCEADSLSQGCVPGEDHSTRVIATDLNSTTFSFNDTTVLPDKTYCYRTSAEYDFPFIEEVMAYYRRTRGNPTYEINEINPLTQKLVDGALACFKTGPEECYLYEDEHCSDETSRSRCVFDSSVSGDVRNSLIRRIDAETSGLTAESADCSDTLAFDENHKCLGPSRSGTVSCTYKSDCEECNTPFGLFHFNGFARYALYSEGQLGGFDNNIFCENIPHCYKDTTETSVNKFFDCSQVSSCYDYKSESACVEQLSVNPDGTSDRRFNNKCLPRNCSWSYDPRYENLGVGVCRELRLDELCPGDNDCDTFPDNATLDGNQIPDEDSDGIADDGTIYDFNLDGIVDYSDEVINSIYKDYAGVQYDIDDDNDLSPDKYDPDPNTFVDDVNQDCHLCDIDGSNLVYEQCDRTRCQLFGSCYWDGSNCLQRSEVTCQMFQNISDCIGPSSAQIDSAIDIIHDPSIDEPGRAGTNIWVQGSCSDGISQDQTSCEETGETWTLGSCSDNILTTKSDCEGSIKRHNFLGLSNDYFGFGTCRWGTPTLGSTPQCFKDADSDLSNDCKLFSAGDSSACQLDMTPPEAKIPHLISYGSPMNISSYIDDYYTDNFLIYYCIGSTEKPCYPDRLLTDMTFNIDDFDSVVDAAHPMFKDEFPLFFIDSSQKDQKLVKVFSTVNTSVGGLQPNFVDQNTGTSECDRWNTNYAELKLPEPPVDSATGNKKEFHCGDGSADDGNYTFYYYIEDLGATETAYSVHNPNNLEEVKNITFTIDTSVPDVMIGIAQKANEVSVNPPIYNTDLTIRLEVNEDVVCKSTLRRVKSYKNSRFECFTEEELPLRYGDIGQIDPYDSGTTVGDYGNNWTVEYTQLQDGLYFFTYLCEDQVHNKQCEGKDNDNPFCAEKQPGSTGCTVDPGYGASDVVRRKIRISSDPTFNIDPYDPIFNTSLMNIHLRASNEFECVYTADPQDFGEDYGDNTWSPSYCSRRMGPFGTQKDYSITSSYACRYYYHGIWNPGVCSDPTYTSKWSCLRDNSPIDGVVFNDGVQQWEDRFVELKNQGQTFTVTGGGDTEIEKEIGGIDYLYDANIPTSETNQAFLYKIICDTTMFGLREKDTFVGVDQQHPVTLFNKPGGLDHFDTSLWYNFKPTIQLDCLDPPVEPEMEYGCTELNYCRDDESCTPDQVAEDNSEMIFIDSDRTQSICYYSKDAGNNQEPLSCDTIKIDRIKPVIYDVIGIPQVTDQLTTDISGKVGNFLTTQFSYDNILSNNGQYKQFNELSDLDDFTLRESFKIGGYSTGSSGLLGSFELARFRYTGSETQQTARYYSIEVVAFEDKLNFILYKAHYKDGEFDDTEIKTYAGLSYVLDNWYDAILTVDNNEISLTIDGQDIFTNEPLSSIDGSPQPEGMVFIPQALKENGDIYENFVRYVSKLAIETPGEYSTLEELKIQGDAYGLSPDNYPFTGTLDDFEAEVALKRPGTNTITITAKDSAGNIGSADFNVYKDEFGPEIYPNIRSNTTSDKGENWSIERIDSDAQNPLHAEYGKPIDIYASILDERFTYLDTVRLSLHNNNAELFILNSRTLLENGGAELGTAGWNWDNTLTTFSSNSNSHFSIDGYNTSSDLIPIMPGLPYTISAELKDGASVFVRWVLRGSTPTAVGMPDCVIHSNSTSFEFQTTTCEAPEDDWFAYAILHINNSADTPSAADNITFEQGIDPSPYYFLETNLQSISNTLWSYTLDVTPGCEKTGACELPVGSYKALFKATDTFNNPSEKTNYFEVKDTIPAKFTVTMTNPDGLEDYMIYGQTYDITFNSDSLLMEDAEYPSFGFKVGNRDFKIQDIVAQDAYTFVGTKTIVGAFLEGFDGVEATFNPVTKDLQGTISSDADVVSGGTFYIDTVGPQKPTIFYPARDTQTVAVGASETFVSGFYPSAQNGAGDINIQLKVNDKALLLPVTFREWKDEASTTSAGDPKEEDLGDLIVMVLDDAFAGSNTVSVSPDYQDLFTSGKYVSFHRTAADPGYRSDGQYYLIESFTVDSETGIGILEFSPSLERNITGATIVSGQPEGGETIRVYEGNSPEGWFGTDVSLMIGKNIIYAFALDDRGVPSRQVEYIQVDSDPFAPNIIIVGPADGLRTPSDVSIIANITENISTITSVRLTIESILPGTDQQRFTECNASGCNYGSWSFRGNDTHKIMTYEPGSDEYIDGIHTITVYAKDEVGNEGQATWVFQKDGGYPFPPIVELDPGESFDNIAYSTDPTKATIMFLADKGKVIDASNIKIIGAQTGLLLEDTNPTPIEVYDLAGIDDVNDIDSEYVTTYEIDLSDVDDDTYTVTVLASKLKNFTDAGDAEWSDEITSTATFIVDKTAPIISIGMQNPTMLKAPKFKITTDDPSTCFFETDEQFQSEETTYDILAKEFNASLREHSFAYINLGPSIEDPVYIQNRDFYEGTHTITVTCENLLEQESTTTYDFSIIPPNRDKIYYQKDDTATIVYKIGIPGLTIDNFDLDFTPGGLAYEEDSRSIPTLQSFEEDEGVYRLTYRLRGVWDGGYYDYPNTHNRVDSTVTYNGEVLTDIPFYIPTHSLAWTADDISNTFDCIDGIANEYFDEVDCNFDVDTIHAKDKKLNNVVERNCFDSEDGDYKVGDTKKYVDGKIDSEDLDCQATYYEIRNNIDFLSAAIDYSDPQQNGVGRLCMGGGSNGYCNNLNDQIQVYYTSRVQPGGDLKLKVISTRNIGDVADTRITLSDIPEEFNIDTTTIGRQQLQNVFEKTPAFCDISTTDDNKCDTIVFGENKVAISGLDEFITIPIPNDQTIIGPYTDMTIKSTVSEPQFVKGPSALAELEIGSEYDTSQESYYTEGGLSVWCNDNIDNDLDSGSNDPMKTSGSTQPDGFDCRDSDCYNKNVNLFSGTYRGTSYSSVTQKCEQQETVCNDAFDNDYDADFSTTSFDFNPNTGIDCRDPDCEDKQGHPTDSSIKCEYEREESCNDGFDNDALNRKDCDMAVTVVGTNPSADTAEYDCAAYCKENDAKGAANENTGVLCRDNLDNDWDFIIQSGTRGYSQNNADGAGIDCRWQNPDEDCEGVIVDFGGKSGSCQLQTETTCNDGFDNDFDHENTQRQRSGWHLNSDLYEILFGESFENAADCDDYDCFDVRDASGNIICTENTSNTAAPQELTCNDGVDNDLDGLKDCLDPDCNGLIGADYEQYDCNSPIGCLCEYETESFCADGFDNDGNEGADVLDGDCKGGFCYYPTPEVENITIDSCMIYTPDEDVDGANCADSDCLGRVCDLNSKCAANSCELITSEICGDLVNNDADNNIDCKDPDCSSETKCTKTGWTSASERAYPHTLNPAIPGSFFRVRYSDYIHKHTNAMGESDGWATVRFVGTNLPAGTVDLQLGTDSVPLTTITGTDLTNNVKMTNTDFTLIEQGTGVLARYSGFTGGNVDVTFKLKAAGTLGNKNLLMSATSGTRAGVGGTDKNIQRTVRLLENTKPTILSINHYSSSDKVQVIASATDASGIAYCRFNISGQSAWSAKQTDCIHTFTGLAGEFGTLTVGVEAVDGAGNIQTKTFTGITLKPLRQDSELKFDKKSHNFFTQEETMTIKQEFSVPITLDPNFFPTTSCKAQIYDEDHNTVGSPTTLTFESDENNAVCYGDIDITSLNNQSSYSIGIIIKRLNYELAAEEKQFFICRYSQNPETGQYRCMDECQLTKGLPTIEITEPEEETPPLEITYPKIPVKGNTIDDPFAKVEIFVNSLTESQYQAEVAAGFFNSTAMVLSKGENTIIARVTDKDQLTNTDQVTIDFDGVNVNTEINVMGLPSDITSIRTTIDILETGEELNTTGTEILMYYESIFGDEEITLTTSFENGIFTSLTDGTQFEPGNYRVEVIPKMLSGKYGLGKLLRFNYCPDGTEVSYDPLPKSRTSNSTILFTGTMSPKPNKADLYIITPDGSQSSIDITPDTEEFSEMHEDIIQPGINTYYIKTEYEGIVCEDIKRSIMLDTEFEGVKKVLIEGQCYTSEDCREGYICIRSTEDLGRCIELEEETEEEESEESEEESEQE